MDSTVSSKAFVRDQRVFQQEQEDDEHTTSYYGGEVYTAKFHPSGNLLASAGFERQIYLWNVYGE